jgi:hypothetical protein
VVVALRRLTRSYRSPAWADTVLDLTTALEACIGPRTKDQEIGLTLRTRAAHLQADDDSEQAETIYLDITDLYGLRSDIIHGNLVFTKDLPTLWEQHGYAQPLPNDRIQLLMDRWREIVRRAIAARLMLADPTMAIHYGSPTATTPAWIERSCDGTDVTSGGPGSWRAPRHMACRCWPRPPRR